ncbi:MAG: hypothetical protein M1836_001440 [Candelina mexicana]|nr:MAG: hypothetical protein M1836_001440 [Candelina mexicana]
MYESTQGLLSAGHLLHLDSARKVHNALSVMFMNAQTTPIQGFATKRSEATVTEEDESSDLSSEEEDHDELGSDVDSDGMEEELMQGFENTDNEDLAQQQDYIRF